MDKTKEQYCGKLKLQEKGLIQDRLTGKVRVQGYVEIVMIEI